MIIIDWSQMLLGGAFAFPGDFKLGKADQKNMTNILRHTILNTIRSDKTKFSQEYGDIFIACDGRNYWRKEEFQYYKASRKTMRAKSDTDWNSIFTIGNQLREEIKEVFPYKMVLVDGAEADDVIAVVVKHLQSNEMIETPLLTTEPQNILIKSSDGDFRQLHKYSTVRQWNPLLKKYVSKPGKNFLLEKLLTGDSGDGVPNVFSYDKQLVDNIRQKAVTEKFKDSVFGQSEIKFEDQTLQRNFERNRLLIDFDYIPQTIVDQITAEYNNAVVVRDKKKIFNYLIKNRCKQLIEHVMEF